MSESLKTKTLKGAMWTGLERIANQFTGFVVSIILARLLSPADYGVIGMMAVFLSVSQLFIDSGLGSALIQKKNRSNDDFSTVFWCNVAISTLCYVILFVASPWIADFYRLPALKNMVRVLGLTLIIQALYTVQVTRLTAMIDFKTQAKVSFSSCVISGIVGVVMAFLGFGAWALITQNIVGCFYQAIVYWWVSGWHPDFVFSGKSFKQLFKFGSRILASSFLHRLYSNISPVIIGRKYSAAMLGVYTRADSLVYMPGGIFQSTLGRVIYPVLSSIQDDDVRLKCVYNKYLRIMTSVVAPSLLLLAAVSEPLILTLIGEKWVVCVPFVMMLSLDWMLDPVILVNLNVLYVKGRSDIVLKLEVIKKIIAIAIVVVSVQFGVIWLCAGRVVYSFIALVLNLRACGPFIGMSFWQQMKEVWIIYAGSFVAAVIAYGVSEVSKMTISMNPEWLFHFSRLAVSGVIGFAAYLLWAKLFRFEIIPEGLAILKRIYMSIRG